jgi:hypothetical protein
MKIISKDNQLKQDYQLMQHMANLIAMNPLDPGEDVIQDYLSARERIRKGDSYRRVNIAYTL